MVIGLRAFPDGFAYVILDGNQSVPKIIAKDRLSLPKRTSWPESLSWVRKQIGEILEQHEISAACVKIVESNARKKSPERFQIEAVLQEYIYTKLSVICQTRIKSQIKRDIRGFTAPARYLEHVLVDSTDLTELNTPQFQDATLAAVAELSQD